MDRLTHDELFGANGIIPLDKMVGFSDAICPHCNSMIRGVNFPPASIIIIHTCPFCKSLIIPFAGRLAAIDKKIINLPDPARARQHISDAIYTMITPLLSGFIKRKQLTPEAARTFLSDCFDIIFELVGEKEDGKIVLQRLKKLASEESDQERARAINAYWSQMEKMLDDATKLVISDVQVAEVKKELESIETVDDFLSKFFK